MKNKQFKVSILLLLIILFLIMRVILLFHSDYIFHPEECFFRTSSYDILNGPSLSLLDYQLESYGGGFLVVNILALPIALLFGISVFSLKLIGLAFSVGILVLIFKICNDFFNRKTAIITSLIYIFAIPYFSISNLITIGNYLESIFLHLLIIYLLFDIIYNKNNKHEKNKNNKNNNKYVKKIILLGLIGGFSLWFYYSTIIIFAVCFLFLLIIKRNIFSKKNFILFIIFFLIGFSPWIISSSLNNFENTTRLEQIINVHMFEKENLHEISIKATKLVTYYIPSSFYYSDFSFISKQVFSYIFYYIFLSFFLLSIFLASKKESSKKELLFITYILIYVLAFIITELKVNYEYNNLWNAVNSMSHTHIFLLQPFMILIVGIGISKIINNIKTKKIGIILLIIVLLIGLIGNINLLNKEFDKDIFKEELCYELLGKSVGWKVLKDNKKTSDVCFKLNNSEFINGCHSGIGETSFFEGNLTKAIQICESMNSSYKSYCYEGMGQTIAARENPTTINEECNLVNKKYIPNCFSGVGREFQNAAGNKENVDLCVKYVDKENQIYCINGAKK